MSQLIDLMPNSALQRMGRARRIQRWVLLYLATIGVLAGTAAMQQMKRTLLEKEVFHTRAQTQGIAEHRVQANRIREDLSRLLWTQSRHDDLMWPVKMHDVTRIVASLVPGSVTLTSVTVAAQQGRRFGAASHSVSSSNGEEGALTLELIGLAGNDVALAHLLSGLESHPLFQSVVVDFSRETMHRDLTGREFGITCRISLDAQYRFESLAQGGDE
ncbi:MAG: PilN domain-containing protein [Planctomycetota bacterium]|jgi:Tfp pilus assembly protein PilN